MNLLWSLKMKSWRRIVNFRKKSRRQEDGPSSSLESGMFRKQEIGGKGHGTTIVGEGGKEDKPFELTEVVSTKYHGSTGWLLTGLGD